MEVEVEIGDFSKKGNVQEVLSATLHEKYRSLKELAVLKLQKHPQLGSAIDICSGNIPNGTDLSLLGMNLAGSKTTKD